jgi:hypothetical protein
VHAIRNAYAGAPYFDAYSTWLYTVLQTASNTQYLAQCNILLIREIATCLGLSSAFHSSKDLDLEVQGTQLNLDIAKHFGATTYLAGTGSLNYEEHAGFVEEEVALRVHDLSSWLAAHPYDQGTGVFTNGLSVVDALMHIGADGIMQLFRQYDAEHAGLAEQT